MSSAIPSKQREQHSKFTAGVIRAIEELEIRRANRTPQELADAAWQKLQYDLPVVERAELQALLAHLRSSFQGKTSWPCYLLTSKALANITTGAKRSTTFDPVLTEQEQQLQQLLDEALSSTLKSKATSNSSSSSTQQQQQQANEQQQEESQSQQVLYQQLCAVLLLQYTAKVTSLPEQDAWQLLTDYQPEQQEEQQACSLDDWQQQQQQQQGQVNIDDSAVLAALAGSAGLSDNNCTAGQGVKVPEAGAAAAAASSHDSTHTASTSIYELQEAAVQDEDGEEYEPIQTLVEAQYAAAFNSSSSRQRHCGNTAEQHQQEQYSWAALRHKLASIAELVHYSLLSYEPLWRKQQAAQHLLQLLRALGVHSHAEELQPVLHAYVALLVDRLAAAPADLPLLQQLWEALGLTGGQGLSAGLSRGAKTRLQALPSEAVLGFSVAASVWAQLPGASARAKLWRLMYDNLLPLLEQCSQQLAYNICSSSSSNNHSQQANGAAAVGRAMQQQQQQQQAVLGEGFAHMLLLSHTVELLVLGRQGGAVDVAGQLTQHGVMRNLVVLFGHHAANAAAEPLRRAVLLASCSSHQAASWVLAVPAVLQQLQQAAFQLGGAAEAHGAVWELLINKHAAAGKAPISSSSSISNGGGAGAAQCGQLLCLLELDPGSVGALQRQLVLLQLLVDVQQAAGRQQMWGDQVAAAVKQLAGRIKELQARQAVETAAAGAVRGGDANAGAAGVETCCTNQSIGNGSAAAAAAAATAAAETSAAVTSRSSNDEGDDEDKGAKAERHQQRLQRQQFEAAGDGDLDHLGRRQSQQLQPAALKLIKQLLTSGGKTD